ncbi:MAG: polysaccharide deacetylase family protein [Reichenbachiella sp.]
MKPTLNKRILVQTVIYTLVLLAVVELSAQPQVSFTFDDGRATDQGGYPLEEWNQMILDKLTAIQVKATFFTRGHGMLGEKGQYVFESWDTAGHQIANHTFSHPNYSSDQVTITQYQAEILKQDSIISPYNNYTRLFRFPYLREGNTSEKVDAMRLFLKEQGYQNGHVTIDDWDWYIDSRLTKRLDSTSLTEDELNAYRTFYVNHIFEVAQRSEALSYELTGRNIKHVMLMHHNLVNALFLDALIEKFKQEGWNFVSSSEAFEDPIYDEVPGFAGNGLLDAIAIDRDMDEFIKELNETYHHYYPQTMDSLGL